MNGKTVITIEDGRGGSASFRIEGSCTGRTPGTSRGNLWCQPKSGDTRYETISETRQLFTVVLSPTSYLVVDRVHREVRLFERTGRHNTFIRSMPL